MIKNNRKKILNVLVLMLSIICYTNSLIIACQYVNRNNALSNYFYSKINEFIDDKPTIAFTKKQLDDNQNDQIYQLLFREYGFKTIYVKDENEINNLKYPVTSTSR